MPTKIELPDTLTPMSRRVHEAILPAFDKLINELREEKANIDHTRKAVVEVALQLILETAAITACPEDKNHAYHSMVHRFVLNTQQDDHSNYITDVSEH